MIPFAVFGCRLNKYDGSSIEIRALEMSPSFFTFRLKRNIYEEVDLSKAELVFYRWDKRSYEKITVMDFTASVIKREKFFDIIRFEIVDPNYKEYAVRLSKEYSEYIDIKLNASESELSKLLTGYSVDEDKIAEDFETQRKVFYNQIEPQKFKSSKFHEYGLCLCRRSVWERYLSKSIDDFSRDYFERYAPSNIDFSEVKLTHLYVGNDFCSLLYPNEDVLNEIIKKAEKENVKCVFVFSMMSQQNIELYKNRLDILKRYTENRKYKFEIVVNDLGMMKLIKEKYAQNFELTAGILLSRRRKDSRINWKRDIDKENLKSTSLNSREYTNILQEMAIKRLSYEYAGYRPEINCEFMSTLYLPYYQTNTSSFCTTYAQEMNGSRGKQMNVMDCEEFCEDKLFLYPDDLRMVGRYNSLFGFSEEILTENDILDYFSDNGKGRIVFNFM